MFCYQCEQTSKGEGCQVIGVCGKDETTAALQDLLLHAVKGISQYAHRAAELGAQDAEIDAFTIQAVFATLTNVNFDPERLVELIQEAIVHRNHARTLYLRACDKAGVAPEVLRGAAVFEPAATVDGLLAQGGKQLLPVRFLTTGKEVADLQELVLYGIKGVAAYAAHALALGAGEPGSFARIHQTLDLLTRDGLTAQDLLGEALAVGALNFDVMEMLDKAHTETFGHPTPTPV